MPRTKDYLPSNVSNVKVKNSCFNEKELFLHRVELHMHILINPHS